MTTIDGTRSPRWRTWLPGVAEAPAKALAEARGCTVPYLLAQLVLDEAAKTAPSVDAGASQPERPDGGPGQGTTRPPAPTVAATYTDPDGDRLALVPLEGRPADWAVRITTADGDGELDVFIEDDETLAGIGRSWLGAIEDRQR